MKNRLRNRQPQTAAARAPSDVDVRFFEACQAAGIKATARQWKKWCSNKGKAFTTALANAKQNTGV
tara:strand:- start:44 stop:241 length:198 start_codon:yes stop_codon:yes gene_type:complete